MSVLLLGPFGAGFITFQPRYYIRHFTQREYILCSLPDFPLVLTDLNSTNNATVSSIPGDKNSRAIINCFLKDKTTKNVFIGGYYIIYICFCSHWTQSNSATWREYNILLLLHYTVIVTLYCYCYVILLFTVIVNAVIDRTNHNKQFRISVAEISEV